MSTALNNQQQQRLLAAEKRREKKERETIELTAPAIEAFLRIVQKAALRSLDGTGSLVAAVESEGIEDEVQVYMAEAQRNLNARNRREPFTRAESAAIWFAVVAALLLAKGRAVPKHLQDSLYESPLPSLAYGVAQKLADAYRNGSIATLAELQERVVQDLQLPRSTASIIRREQAGALFPHAKRSELGKIFEGTVIEISRTSSTMFAGVEEMEMLRAMGAEKKMWASVWLDDRVRPSHMAAHGQVQPVEKTFYVGDSRLMYPGDPSGAPQEVISCRCVLIEA